LGAIVQNRNEYGAAAGRGFFACNLERGHYGCGGGDAHQQPLAARDLFHHRMGSFRFHRELAVGEMGVIDGRHDGCADVPETVDPMLSRHGLNGDGLERGFISLSRLAVPMKVPLEPRPATR